MSPCREPGRPLGRPRSPCQAPQCALASSTSESHSALPANASTMLDGLYRRAKYSRIWSASSAVIDSTVPRMLLPSGCVPKWAALAAS